MTTAAPTRTSAGIGTSSGAEEADPVRTEVIRHGLVAAADQMRIVLRRTAFSPAIYEITDFAAALYDDKMRLLAQGRALPIFLGTLSFCLESAVNRVGGPEALEPGDVLLNTYGYDIGSHPQDMAIIVPGFHDGELVGYAVVKAHHLDLGAKDPYCTDTTDVFQEGTIFPGVFLYKAGELRDDIHRTLLANSRLPKAMAGDLAAQVGAAKVGLEGLYRVIERAGLAEYRNSVELMLDHGEQMAREIIAGLPDGRYVGRGEMDDNGVTDSSTPFEIGVEVRGDRVIVDFSDSPPPQGGPTNCPLPTTVSAARLAIVSLAGGRESANEGHFRPIEVLTRPGTMFHPLPPSPIFLYAWPALQAVDAIHRAFAEAMPEIVPAGSGGDYGFMQWWGDNGDGTLWGDAMDHSMGQGATDEGDGGPPLMHLACSGVKAPSVEVWEARHPVRIQRYECTPDSAGAGRFRGGPGVEIRYEALEDCYFTSTFERTKTRPPGNAGGGSGEPTRIRLHDPDGSFEEFGKATAMHVRAGSVLEVRTGGGGGYGDPAQRDVGAVHDDVAEGYLSEEVARRDYPHAFERDGRP